MTEKGAPRLTSALADFTSEVRYEALPDAVVAEAKRLLLDTLGCALGGLALESAERGIEFIGSFQSSGTATVLGQRGTVAAPLAAYANGRSSNVLDFDDTFPTGTHFGGSAVFSGMAAVQERNADGRTLLTSIAVGYDVGARIASWLGVPFAVTDGKLSGWSGGGGPVATMTWASAAAASSAWGLSAEETLNAFGIAGANTPQSTLQKWAEAPSQTMYKYGDPGWCSLVGTSSALLAKLGTTGLRDILDGPNGFWKFFGASGHVDERLSADLATRWHIVNNSYKPWPCCRWIHQPLTALSRLLAENDLGPEDVKRVTVRACPVATTPIFCDQDPTDPLTAQFSHAHAVAAVLRNIPPGPRWYAPDVLGDPGMRSLRQRVVVTTEPSALDAIDNLVDGQWRNVPGGVDVETTDGRTLSYTARNAEGDSWDADTRWTDDDIISKFTTVVDSMRPASSAGSSAQRVVDSVMDVDRSASLDELLTAVNDLAMSFSTH